MHCNTRHTLVTITGDSPRRAAAVRALAQLPPPWTCRAHSGSSTATTYFKEKFLQAVCHPVCASGQHMQHIQPPRGFSAVVVTHEMAHLQRLRPQLFVWPGVLGNCGEVVHAAAAHAHHLDWLFQSTIATLFASRASTNQ